MAKYEHDVMPKHPNGEPFKYDEDFIKRIKRNLKIVTLNYRHAKQDKEMLKMQKQSG